MCSRRFDIFQENPYHTGTHFTLSDVVCLTYASKEVVRFSFKLEAINLARSIGIH